MSTKTVAAVMSASVNIVAVEHDLRPLRARATPRRPALPIDVQRRAHRPTCRARRCRPRRRRRSRFTAERPGNCVQQRRVDVGLAVHERAGRVVDDLLVERLRQAARRDEVHRQREQRDREEQRAAVRFGTCTPSNASDDSPRAMAHDASRAHRHSAHSQSSDSGVDRDDAQAQRTDQRDDASTASTSPGNDGVPPSGT